MLTDEQFKEYLTKVSEISGDNESVMTVLKEMQDAYEAPPIYTDDDVINKESGKRWSEDYSELKKAYRDRFFSKGEIIEQQKEDVSDDEKAMDISFEDLFEEKKGE